MKKCVCSIELISFLIVLTNAKVPCNPESFNLLNTPRTVHHNQSYLVKLGTREEEGCAINASYRWQLFSEQNYIFVPEKTNIFQFGTITQNRWNILYFGNLSEKNSIFGNKYIVRVTLIPRPTHYPSYRLFYLRVLLEQYKIIIVGGDLRNHSIGKGSLWLNASIERETGVPLDVKSIAWQCIPSFGTSRSEKLKWEVLEFHLLPNRIHNCTVTIRLQNDRNISCSQMIHVKPPESNAVLEIICISNCLDANSSKETILQYVCHANCKGKAGWTIDPFVPQIKDKFIYPVYPAEAIIIPPNTFEMGKHYEIIASLGYALGHFTVNYIMPQSDIKLECVENCFVRSATIKLKASCPNWCFSDVYTWGVDPEPKAWGETKYGVSDDPSEFVFYPGTLIPEIIISVRVRNAGGHAFLSFTVDKTIPEIIIERDKGPKEVLNPMIEHTLVVRCLVFCSAIHGYFWQFSPGMVGTNWWKHSDNKNETIIIPPKAFLGIVFVNVTVYPYDLGKPASTVLYFNIQLNLSIRCIPPNCYNFSGLLYVDYDQPCRFIAVCVGDCVNMTYKWFLSPYPPSAMSHLAEYIVRQENNELVIPNDFVENYITYMNITIQSHLASASKTVWFQNKKIDGKLNIKCIKNCFSRPDPTYDIILLGHCITFCALSPFIWDIEDYYEERMHWHDKIVLSYLNRTMTIKKFSFKPGENITVSLRTSPTNRKLYNIHFRKISPPFKMICTSNCKDISLTKEIIILIKCTYFCQDFSKANVHLKFLPQARRTDKIEIKSEGELKYVRIPPLSIIKTTLVTAEIDDSSGNLLISIPEFKSVHKFECLPKDCSSPQNIRKKFIIKAICIDVCGENPWKWVIMPWPDDKKWDKHVIHGFLNRSLTILPNTFQHDDELLFYIADDKHFDYVFITFVEKSPTLEVVCVRNCNHSQPHDDVEIKVICDYRCEFVESYDWTLQPAPPNFQENIEMSANNLSIIIKQGAYEDGDVVIVTAHWSVFEKNLTIFFVEKYAELEIVCLRNCDSDTKSPVVLEMICHQHCTDKFPKTWTIAEGRIPVSFYNYNKTIVIAPDTYDIYDEVPITVCQHKSCATKKIVFQEHKFVLEIIVMSPNYKNGVLPPIIPSVFRAHCVEDCFPNIKYNWSLSPFPIIFIKNIDYFISTDTNIFTIRGNFFRNTTCVLISLQSGRSLAKLKMCYIQPMPIARIICVANCGYPDPSLETVYAWKCYEHCFTLTVTTWLLYPMNDNILFDNWMITILRHSFEDQQSVKIIAVTAEATFTRTITFALPSAILLLSCNPSCSKLNPRQPVSITVTCIDYCGNYYKYNWDLKPKLNNFVWSLNVSLSRSNRTIRIHEQTYVNNSIVFVSVETDRGSRVATEIVFFEPTPQLFLNCTSTCTIQPEKRNSFAISCVDCPDLKGEIMCFLNPPPADNNSLFFDDKLVVIRNDSYSDGNKVILNCSVFSTFKAITLHFKVGADTSLFCTVLPLTGISGVTRHTFECTNYLQDGTYQVYQHISCLFNPISKFKLYEGFIPMATDLLLCPGMPTTVSILIGRNWETIFVKNVTLNILPLFNNEQNITFERFKSNFLKNFSELLNKGEFNKALNLANVAECTLKFFNEEERLSLNEIILHNLFNVLPYVEPSPVLQLIELIICDYYWDMLVMEQIIQLTAESCLYISHWNRTYYHYDKMTISSIGSHVLEIVNKLTGQYFFVLDNHLSKFNYDDEIGSLKFADLIHHIKHFLIAYLQTFGCVMDLIARPKKHFIITKDYFSLVINRANAKDFTLQKLIDNNTKTFIEVDPVTFFTKLNQRITFKMAAFYVDFLKWIKPSKAVIVFFVAELNNSKEVQGDIRLGIKLNIEKPLTVISTDLSVNMFQAWKIIVPVNYTLEIKVLGENVSATLGMTRPNKTFLLEEGTRWGIKYKFVEKSPLYLGMVGSGDVLLKLSAIACWTWHGEKWVWGFDGCFVSPDQFHEESGLIICECNKFSLFTVDSERVTVKPVRIVELSPFDKLPQKNEASYIYIIILTVIAMFVLLSIIRDALTKQNDVIYIWDNDVNDSKVYLIAVQTGFWWDSGTSARVALQIQGTEATSKIHLLNANNKCLERNSKDIFKLLTSTSLGQLTCLRIWHDSYGNHSDWFCDTIVVKDIQTDQAYVFAISRWFSLTRSPFTTIGFFRPASSKRPISLSVVYNECLRIYYSGISIWTGSLDGYTQTKNAIMTGLTILLLMAIITLMIPETKSGFLAYFRVYLVAITLTTAITIPIDFVMSNVIY